MNNKIFSGEGGGWGLGGVMCFNARFFLRIIFGIFTKNPRSSAGIEWICKHLTTASQYEGKYLCGASLKIIRFAGCNFFLLYTISFPDMYNTWRSSVGQNGSNNYFLKKTPLTDIHRLAHYPQANTSVNTLSKC